MKKIAVVIMSFLYLSTASGANIHLHYCMGKLVNWSIWKDHKKKCGKCGMEKDHGKGKGCCKDESRYIKSVTEHKSVESTFQLLQLNSIVLPPALLLNSFQYNDIIEYEIPLSNSPPPNGNISLCIANCVFKI